MNKPKSTLTQKRVSGSYFDNVLIKLRRTYTKDETVSALSKKLTETELELGKAISYIHELEFEKHKTTLKNGGQEWFEKYKKLKERFDKLNEDLKNDKLYFNKCKENSKLHSELKKIKKQNEKLVKDISALENNINSSQLTGTINRFRIIKTTLSDFSLFAIADDELNKVVCHLVHDNGELYCEEMANKILNALNKLSPD